MSQEKNTQAEPEKKEFKEITLKFGKGLVGDPFKAKDGKEYRSIKIPNKDEADKSPWASFVVRSNSVHEDQFGKGMWTKLPSEGSTTIAKPVVVGQNEKGKNVWETEKTKVPNKELKKMVEFYKERPREVETAKDNPFVDEKAADEKPSVMDKIAEKKQEIAKDKGATDKAEKTKAPKKKEADR